VNQSIDTALPLHKNSSPASSASSCVDGRQNGWKYYWAKGIDELISANIIMCSVRASALDRTGCFSDKQERACVRLTRLSDEIYLEIKQARSLARFTSRLALHLSDRGPDCGDGRRLRSRLTSLVLWTATRRRLPLRSTSSVEFIHPALLLLLLLQWHDCHGRWAPHKTDSHRQNIPLQQLICLSCQMQTVIGLDAWKRQAGGSGYHHSRSC